MVKEAQTVTLEAYCHDSTFCFACTPLPVPLPLGFTLGRFAPCTTVGLPGILPSLGWGACTACPHFKQTKQPTDKPPERVFLQKPKPPHRAGTAHPLAPGSPAVFPGTHTHATALKAPCTTAFLAPLLQGELAACASSFPKCLVLGGPAPPNQAVVCRPPGANRPTQALQKVFPP